MNLFKILNISENASQTEIRQAYLKLVKLNHPDKNNSKCSHEKFIEINSAYEILYNKKTNKFYNLMNEIEKNNFNDLLKKIININNSQQLEDFINYFTKLNKSDFEYIKNNFINFIKEINVIELFELFNNGKLLKKNNLILSDTESDIILDYKYYYILPIFLQKNNNLDIKIDLSITLEEIITNSKKKIKIKRKINNIKSQISTFIFNITHPYIVFYDYGDSIDNEFGNLIIKLNLPNNIYWNDNILFIEYPMKLFELVYGININLNNLIIINNWIPYINGFCIDVSKNINIIIKLFLDFNDNIDTYNILKKIE
jgi:curved DNA-binding protein CbpA